MSRNNNGDIPAAAKHAKAPLPLRLAGIDLAQARVGKRTFKMAISGHMIDGEALDIVESAVAHLRRSWRELNAERFP